MEFVDSAVESVGDFGADAGFGQFVEFLVEFVDSAVESVGDLGADSRPGQRSQRRVDAFLSLLDLQIELCSRLGDVGCKVGLDIGDLPLEQAADLTHLLGKLGFCIAHLLAQAVFVGRKSFRQFVEPAERLLQVRHQLVDFFAVAVSRRLGRAQAAVHGKQCFRRRTIVRRRWCQRLCVDAGGEAGHELTEAVDLVLERFGPGGSLATVAGMTGRNTGFEFQHPGVDCLELGAQLENPAVGTGPLGVECD